jgi:predicted transcriptional regulator
MTTRKQRHQVYLPDDLSAALDALGNERGSSKSAVVARALQAWLDSRAGSALDDRFGVRLDRLGRADERLERKLDFLTEALGMFVQHQLTVVAHMPAFTPEAASLGQQRYRAFIDAVGRKLARPKDEGAPFGSTREVPDRRDR